MTKKNVPTKTEVQRLIGVVRRECAFAVRQAMERQGLSSRQVAELLGVGHTTMADWLGGDRKWDVGYFRACCEIVGLDSSEVLSLTGKRAAAGPR